MNARLTCIVVVTCNLLWLAAPAAAQIGSGTNGSQVPDVKATLGLTLLSSPPAKADSPALDPGDIGVRLLLGVNDRQPARWDGSARLSVGEIRRIDPWRFRPADAIVGTSGWKTASHVLATPPTGPLRMSPTGVVLTLAAPRGATLDVETEQGKFSVPLKDLVPGRPVTLLDGRVAVDRVAPAVQLTQGDDENDFPAAAVGPDGSIWVAFVQHTHRGPVELQSFEQRPTAFYFLIPKGGGDQVAITRFDGKRWSAPLPITATGLDVWRPAVAFDGQGRIHVVWSQNEAGNWDLFEQVLDPRQFPLLSPGAARRLTTDPGPDLSAVMTSDKSGRVWVAWQNWRNSQADIWLMQLAAAAGEAASRQLIRVTPGPGNKWSPAIATDSRGRVYVAYDSYAAGNYDVYLQSYAEGRLSPPIAVATSSRYEANPSIVCDLDNRVWVSYEQRGAEWGKDSGPYAAVQGSPLYLRGASVQVRVLEGERLMQTAEAIQEFPSDLQVYNSYPRLGIDGNGRLWLAFRHHHEAIWGNSPHIVTGGVWLEYATSFDGERWSPPVFLAASDNTLDMRPTLARAASGRMVAVYPGDHRLRHEVLGEGKLALVAHAGGGVAVPGQAKNELFAAMLPEMPAPKSPALAAVRADVNGPAGPSHGTPRWGNRAVEPDSEPKGLHPNSVADVKRMRDYVIDAGGKKYWLLRGEFHRHTELSPDGGNDGSLEDMWRYALDAADFDWIGNGDHDNGSGREYPWWLIQKTTDMYTVAPRFVPMFTFERSVPYPNGHRNAMFDHRGVRTLPRLLGDEPGGVSRDDSKMFYAYLEQLGGICASHTSGTSMGTDWRDNDPKVEPVVEIYQGDRNSYETLGGPRVAAKPAESYSTMKPLGMVWNALAMGYRLGFQSSSDHWSTHISYAVVLAEDHTRPAIIDAFRKRHCYAATDNILMDVRMGEHVMGDDFVLREPVKPTVAVRVHGTTPLARVDVIKDFVVVYSVEPKQAECQFQWVDWAAKPGESWYYVRVLQSDQQVGWSSPIWVTIPAKK